jgi:hypothetical protein
MSVIIILLISGILHAQGPSKPTPATLTLEDVVGMLKSGLSEDLVITTIKSKGKPFDLSPAEITELKNSGISETVIGYLLDPTKPYTAPAPRASPAGTTVAPAIPAELLDPLAAKTPPEPGIYYLRDGRSFVFLNLKPVVPTKQDSKNTKLFGLVKGHIIGSILEPKADVRIKAGEEAIFVLRLAEKGTIDDYALLRLDPADGRRNLDFGKTPGKPVFPIEVRAAFQNKRLAQGIYRLSVRQAEKGEYLFLILGSGDESKGLLGKGCDFGVD